MNLNRIRKMLVDFGLLSLSISLFGACRTTSSQVPVSSGTDLSSATTKEGIPALNLVKTARCQQ